ncbi:hypothetical protein, partial [Pseudophaeobacter arcticus]|uniref:hypothetical protein n=1 Tax=Pseudophaeobacter arcticus TaxID=385492 RepID=UPI0024936B00
MVNEKTERETHELVLAAILQGRLLAQEWQDVGLVPQGAAKPFVLDLLHALHERRGLQEMDEERIRMLGDQIRRFTNEHREGLGDRGADAGGGTRHDSGPAREREIGTLGHVMSFQGKFQCSRAPVSGGPQGVPRRITRAGALSSLTLGEQLVDVVHR